MGKTIPADRVERYVAWLSGKKVGVVFEDCPYGKFYATVVRRRNNPIDYNLLGRERKVIRQVIRCFADEDIDRVMIFNVHGGIRRSTVWHEVGHIMHEKLPEELRNDLMWSEYSAHAWALNEADRRGYSKVFGELYAVVEHWYDMCGDKGLYGHVAWRLMDEWARKREYGVEKWNAINTAMVEAILGGKIEDLGALMNG